MQKKLISGILVLSLLPAAWAQTNVVEVLPAVVVWGAREKVRVARVSEELGGQASSALSTRGQGVAGTITDLSVNGSSFSEAGVVFNGATIRQAQTEHFNADLPVSADWLDRPRVLTGLDLFRLGSGHPAGSLAVALEPPDERGGKATFGVGLDGLVFGRLNDIETFDLGTSGRGWVGAFAEAAHADKTDGYESNPMDRATFGGRMGFGTDVWTFDSLVSWQWRDFGCIGAYGANEKYSAWEEDRTGLVSANWKYDAQDDQVSELALVWTRGRDAYWLYRDNPDFYKNTHLADSVTLRGTTRRHFADWAFVDLRSEADAEVYSTRHHTNYSGTNPKSKTEDFRRFHGSVAALPGVRWGDWEFAAGAAAELYSDYSGTCAPAGGLTYLLDEDAKVGLSYREGTRQPSYTELTYDSPDSKGMIDLPLQRTRSVNLDGTVERKGDVRRARGGLFLMQSEDLVDWLKANRASGWKATALDPVTAFGFSGEAEWAATKALTVMPRGAFVLKQTSTDFWSSRYAMDFPIFTGSIECAYQIAESWRVSYKQGLAVWKANPVRRGDSVQNISRLETVFQAPFCRNLEVTLGLSDLFNQAFEVYPGQKALGLTGYLAVTYRW